MKPVERAEVLALGEYEVLRDRFRARIIEEKRRRRVALVLQASCVFENHDTVLLQIQEMLRTERITRESAVQHEIDTYNQLVPGPGELSATILVEIADKAERDRFLVEARGLDRSFAVDVAGERCPGRSDESREDDERTTAVHYIKFALTPKAERALRDVLEKKATPRDVEMALVALHPRYTARTALPPEVVASLAEDLA